MCPLNKTDNTCVSKWQAIKVLFWCSPKSSMRFNKNGGALGSNSQTHIWKSSNVKVAVACSASLRRCCRREDLFFDFPNFRSTSQYHGWMKDLKQTKFRKKWGKTFPCIHRYTLLKLMLWKPHSPFNCGYLLLLSATWGMRLKFAEWVSEFQALKFCWKVQGELWFNKVSRAMRFNSQSVVVVSSFNHHCLCHCWFWTTTQLLGLCSEKKKIKCSFAYQESDLARQKNKTFWSYAESERVRFSNPMARESLPKHQKTNITSKRIEILSGSKPTILIYLPQERWNHIKFSPKNTQWKSNLNSEDPSFLLWPKWIGWPLSNLPPNSKVPNWVLSFKSSSCAVSSASSSSHMMSKLPSPLSFFTFTLDMWGWLGREFWDRFWGEFLSVGSCLNTVS